MVQRMVWRLWHCSVYSGYIPPCPPDPSLSSATVSNISTHLWCLSKFCPGPTLLHPLHHTIKPSNRILLCIDRHLCADDIQHILLPKLFFRLHRTITQCT